MYRGAVSMAVDNGTRTIIPETVFYRGYINIHDLHGLLSHCLEAVGTHLGGHLLTQR